ncbi:MAG: hypothetical protein QHC40_06685 [Sphingobium sp.]|nr:hypothetical protein [Sphingobium sp.]
MLALMSAFPSIGPVSAEDWPMLSIVAGTSTAPFRHAIDLARLFGGQADAWPDALISETRRHLGGCLNAVETGLRLATRRDERMAGAIDALPDRLVWPMVLLHPGMIGPGLLHHMRLRAGLSILLRQVGRAGPDADAVDAATAIDFTDDDDPQVRDAAVALALAEGRWVAAGSEDRPMRPDVPAEQYVELVWMAAAALAAAMARNGLVSAQAATDALQRAGQALLAQHDEAQGAIALADRLVRQLGPRADQPDHLGQALVQRRHLLFAALAARHVRMDTGRLIKALLAGPIGQVAALCHVLGGSRPDYRHLLLALQPVRPTLTDGRIVELAADYAALDAAEADAVVARMRAPHLLNAGMALLARHDG